MEPLTAQSAIQIQKPVAEVFEAIVDPSKISSYFLSRSSGRIAEGATLIWNFPEFDMDVPVQGGKVMKPEYISFTWDANGKPHLVEIALQPQTDGSTVVTVSETGAENNAAGILWLRNNTSGWAHFLAFLKAYLEHGINLRKGAFEFMKASK